MDSYSHDSADIQHYVSFRNTGHLRAIGRIHRRSNRYCLCMAQEVLTMNTLAMIASLLIPSSAVWGMLILHHVITRHDINHVRRTSARFHAKHYYDDAGIVDLSRPAAVNDTVTRGLADGNHHAGYNGWYGHAYARKTLGLPPSDIPAWRDPGM